MANKRKRNKFNAVVTDKETNIYTCWEECQAATKGKRKGRLTNRFCNQKRPMDIWGGGGFVLDVSFVTNKHRFLGTQ